MPISRAKKLRQRRKTRKARRARARAATVRNRLPPIRAPPLRPNNMWSNNDNNGKNGNNGNKNNNSDEEEKIDVYKRPYQLLPKEFPAFTNDFYQFFYYDKELRDKYFKDKVVLDVGTRDGAGMVAMCMLGAKAVLGIDPDDSQFHKLDSFAQDVKTDKPCTIYDPVKQTLQEFQVKYPTGKTRAGKLDTICILLWNIPAKEYHSFMRALVKLCDKHTTVIISYVDAEYELSEVLSVENLFRAYFKRMRVFKYTDIDDTTTYRLSQNILIAKFPKQIQTKPNNNNSKTLDTLIENEYPTSQYHLYLTIKAIEENTEIISNLNLPSNIRSFFDGKSVLSINNEDGYSILLSCALGAKIALGLHEHTPINRYVHELYDEIKEIDTTNKCSIPETINMSLEDYVDDVYNTPTEEINAINTILMFLSDIEDVDIKWWNTLADLIQYMDTNYNSTLGKTTIIIVIDKPNSILNRDKKEENKLQKITSQVFKTVQLLPADYIQGNVRSLLFLQEPLESD
jgi:hypothetical protein